MDGKDDVKGKKYELNLKKSTIAIEIRETTKIALFFSLFGKKL